MTRPTDGLRKACKAYDGCKGYLEWRNRETSFDTLDTAIMALESDIARLHVIIAEKDDRIAELERMLQEALARYETWSADTPGEQLDWMDEVRAVLQKEPTDG